MPEILKPFLRVRWVGTGEYHDGELVIPPWNTRPQTPGLICEWRTMQKSDEGDVEASRLVVGLVLHTGAEGIVTHCFGNARQYNETMAAQATYYPWQKISPSLSDHFVYRIQFDIGGFWDTILPDSDVKFIGEILE